MISRHFVFALWAALLLAAPPAFAGARAARAGVTAEDPNQARVIVKYRSDSALVQAQIQSASGAARLQSRHAGALGQRLGLPLQDGRVLGAHTQALRGQGLSSAALAARLRQQADVEWAVVDERRNISAAPNDPLYAGSASTSPVVGQWYLRAPDSTAPAAINAAAAWDISTGSASITVAVLDTGVRFDHPDFIKADGASKLFPGYDFVSNVTSAGDNNGADGDASDPGDFTTASTCGSGGSASSSSWHGTQTAGIVGAATDNSIGMASVGRNVMILPVRVLGKCGGSDSDIIAAMYWAAGLSTDTTLPVNIHPAKVISMSLGKSGACPASYVAVFSALATAGVTVVVAAGNNEGLAVEAPANCSGALAVGAIRHIGSKVGFSAVGTEVAISAPGGNCVNLTGACLYPILTTTNLGSTTPSSSGYSDSTTPSVGTSFSTPLVAGALALMLSVDPTLKPAALLAKMRATARAFPTSGSGAAIVACRAPSATVQDECYCTTSTCGAGMLDVAAAVASAVPSSVAPPAAVAAASNASPTVGDSVTLSSAGSGAFGGRSIAAYAWSVTAGGTLASLSGATNGANATLATSAAGTVTVSLTVTDNTGATGTASTTLTVQAAAPPTPPSSGGGGGAMSAPWLALLALAVWLLQRRPAPAGQCLKAAARKA